MPQIKIKRGEQTSSSHPTLDDGELYLANDGAGEGKLYAGTSDGDTNTDKVRVKYSDNSDYAEKVGTESSHPQIGSPTKLLYVADTGVITESNANVGEEGNAHGTDPAYIHLIFMKNGTMTGASVSVGDATTPVYVDRGSIKPSDKYAGGTKVTLNGTPLDGQDATIYAPVAAPSSTGWSGAKIPLYQNGQAPVWSSGTFGSERQPLYLDGFGDLAKGREYHAPTTYGTRGQIAMSKGNNSDTEWSDCLDVPFASNRNSINDNGIYAISIRVSFATATPGDADCTVFMAVTDKNKLNWSSTAKVYLSTSLGAYAYVSAYRSTDGSLGAVITDNSTPSVSCLLLGVYKLADTH